MSTSTDRKVTPLELLRIREESWARRLSPTRIGLVAEDVTTSTAHSEQALRWLGGLWQQQGPGSTLLRRFPAVHVLTTTRVATDHYAAKFWPQLCERAGIPKDPNIQHDWGTAYINNLRQLGLPTFDDVEDRGSRFVGPILMHSGVPTYCLPDLLRLARDRRRMVPGLTPESFVDWARERARQDRLRHIDKPVQRFLRYGGEFAVDVVDRVFELLDVVSAGGTGDDVELPQRFRAAATDLRDEGESLSAPSGPTGEFLSVAPRRAALMLDPYGRGPFVRLPSIPDADEGQVVWVVGADAEEERVPSLALMPGYREPTPQVDVPVNRPVRQLTARLEGSTVLDLTVPVVDNERPLLVFDEEGVQLGLGSPLRRGAVWILHPSTHPLEAPASDKVMTRAALPPGWDGWELVLLDLDGVQQLRLTDGPTVEVQARAVPRIHMPEPVAGARTMSGDAIFADLPQIELPDLGDDGPAWSVSLVDHTGAVVVRRDVSTEVDCARVWESAPQTLCGEVHLRIRGPWGRTASRRFTLVQGLTVDSDPAWRRMTGRGLAPAIITLAASPGIRVSTHRLELDTRQVRRVVTVATGPEKLPVVVEPAHMSVSHLTPTKTGRESVTALTLRTEAVLDDPGVLVVDTGAQASPVLHVHGPRGFLQTVEPSATTGGSTIYRFGLAQITDTLRAEQQMRLSLDREATLTVAHVRPGRLFSTIAVENSQLVLAGAPAIEGLTAICYRATAPWTSAQVLPVTDGTAQLPESLVGVGPLLVHVRVEDPWVPEPVPAWPVVAQWVEQPGHLDSGPGHEVLLSGFLAGEAHLDGYDGELAPVWVAYDRLWQLGLGDRSSSVDEALRSILVSTPGKSTAALAEATIEPERVPQLLARTGLVAAPLSDESLDRVPVRQANVLPLTFLGAWSGGYDTVDALTGVTGEVARDVAEGTDPLAGVGGFDQTAEVLARMSPADRHRIYRTAGIVPTGLLDKDSRVLAAESVLAERDGRHLSWLRVNAGRLTAELRRTFLALGEEHAVAAMDARRHPTKPHGWRAIPEWSIGMAMACRLTAHREVTLPVVTSGLRALKDLSTACPRLVTIDLVLADLLVRDALNRKATP